MNKKIRLYFFDKIQSDLVAHLKKEQSHYLKDVMRLKSGDTFSVFNSQGEWNASVKNYEKQGAKIKNPFKNAIPIVKLQGGQGINLSAITKLNIEEASFALSNTSFLRSRAIGIISKIANLPL